eukprot:jgi/Mesen1/4853/ME000244S04029
MVARHCRLRPVVNCRGPSPGAARCLSPPVLSSPTPLATSAVMLSLVQSPPDQKGSGALFSHLTGARLPGGSPASVTHRQWDALVQQFQEELYRMYGMTDASLLHIHLQAGLSALKTPFAYEEGCPKEDPLSQEALRRLAEPLPFSKHGLSKLVCRITKEPMDDHNPPMVLPNGFVYSQKAMDEMARKNQGKIICPRSGAVYTHSQLVKAYVF